MFDVRRSSVSFSIKLAAFQASGADRMRIREAEVFFPIRPAVFWPAAVLSPEPLNPEPVNGYASGKFDGDHLPAFSGD